MINCTVFDFHTLHILAADVQNEIYAWQKFVRSTVVGHGFDDALVSLKTCLNQSFTVTGHRGSADKAVLRQLAVYVRKEFPGRFQRISFVISVERVEQIAFRVDERTLGSRRTGIDAQEAGAVCLFQRFSHDFCLIMTFLEGIIFLLIMKQRLYPLGGHTCDRIDILYFM